MAQIVPTATDAEPGVSTVEAPGGAPVTTTIAEERVSVASQWQLMWWRFRKHKLAIIGAIVVLIFYAMVILADFLAYSDPEASEAQRGLIAPQPIHWFTDDGSFFPHVYGLAGKRDPVTFKRVYAPDPSTKVPVTFFA